MPKTPSFILKKIEECRATQAKSLDLRGGDDFGEIRLIAIPPEVFNLTQLESLDLRNNAIQVVPNKIKQLTQLKRLDLRGNPLRQVADVAGLFVHYADFVNLKLPYKNIIGLKLTLSSHDAPARIFELPNLTALEISNHRLTQIPDWVLKLEKLTELDLSRNSLREISGLETLVNLSSLDLSYNQLSSLSGLEMLVNLYSLDLSDNQLSSLSGLETLINLSSLNLSWNKLSSLSGIETLLNLSSLGLGGSKLSNLSKLETLVNLSSLDLSYMRLSTLSGLEKLVNLSSLNLRGNLLHNPSWLEVQVYYPYPHLYLEHPNRFRDLQKLENLVNLSSLNLSDNQLSNLSGLEQLVNLSSLDLSWNPSINLSGLEKLINLSSLSLSGNQLSNLSEIENLINLHSLDLSQNRLSNLSGLEKLINLSLLDLKHNMLGSLSGLETLLDLSSLGLGLGSNQLGHLSRVDTLVNLSSLDLSYNELGSLSEIQIPPNLYFLNLTSNKLSNLSEIEIPTSLSSLVLSYNQLNSLSGMEKLVDLSFLVLSHNQLNSLSGIDQLSNLSFLDLTSNKLSSLSGIEKLPHLNVLFLGGNKMLEKLDDELFKLPKLDILGVFEFDKNETAITYPPLEQLEPEGAFGKINIFRVRNYLHQLEDERDYLYEAKLLIVGEGGAGKTSLMRKIKDPTYELVETPIVSTEGIDVENWSFTYKQHPFRVNIWDFGGQEIYHATHQFFLTQNALYVLVTDNRKEDTDFYFWLNTVRVLSNDSPLLIFQNKKDECQGKINESELRGEFKSLKDIYALNLKNCVDEFEKFANEELQFYLTRLPHISKPIPKKWLTVRTTLENDARNHIELSEFLKLCEQNGFKHEEDKFQLSKTLHELGTILHFQDELLLGNTIFLKPHWVTTAVYHVLDNAQVKANHGKFTCQQLKDIWHESEYNFMHTELLELMLKFKLCYPLNYCENEKTYIAPQLLSENPPAYELPTQDNVIVYYENYAFMPKGMVRQLIVLLHQHIAKKQQWVWKSGVVLEKDQTYAEVIENYGKREIKIRVIGKNRLDLMTIVMYELEKIHASYHNKLIYKVSLPCSCVDPEYFPFKDLKEFAAHKVRIQCRKSGCWKLLNAHDLIEGVLHFTDDERKSGGTGDVHINIGNRPVNVTGGSRVGSIVSGNENAITHHENFPKR